MAVDRRRFLSCAAAAGGAVLSGFRPLLAADAEIEVDPSRPGTVISPHL
jgi:hypothetical protein